MKLKEKCSTCGQAMEMYYQPWCPKCEKPEVETVKVINLIKACNHLEANGIRTGIKERLWQHLTEGDFGNDRLVWCCVVSKKEAKEYENGAELAKDYAAIKEHFGLTTNDWYWEVSW